MRAFLPCPGAGPSLRTYFVTALSYTAPGLLSSPVTGLILSVTGFLGNGWAGRSPRGGRPDASDSRRGARPALVPPTVAGAVPAP